MIEIQWSYSRKHINKNGVTVYMGVGRLGVVCVHLAPSVNVSGGLGDERLLDSDMVEDRTEQLEGVLHIGTAIGCLWEGTSTWR